MLALLFDVLAGYLLVRHIQNRWIQIGCGVIAGIFNSVLANLLIYFFLPDMRPGEVIMKTISGVIWHPLFTLIALWYFRRKTIKE